MSTQHNKVYVVLEGMEGGYVPNNAAYFRYKYQAQDCAHGSAENARYDGYKVTGSARSGLYILDSGRSLNEYIEISESSLAELGLNDYAELESLNNS